jgi:hypothetical protein
LLKQGNACAVVIAVVASVIFNHGSGFQKFVCLLLGNVQAVASCNKFCEFPASVIGVP